jgi:hypothetical protein
VNEPPRLSQPRCHDLPSQRLWYICESAPMAMMSMLVLPRHTAASICWDMESGMVNLVLSFKSRFEVWYSAHCMISGELGVTIRVRTEVSFIASLCAKNQQELDDKTRSKPLRQK